jgi:hypothetical protein
MGVQIRVTGTRVAVRERGCDQPADIDLPDPVPALPGEQYVAFDEGQRIVNGGLVRSFDLRPRGAGRRPPTMSTPT